MAIVDRRLTLEEFLALPEEKPALEFVDGVVSQKVSPKIRHGGFQFEVAALFNQFARPRKLARAFTETRATFAGASLVPDVLVYRWERIPRAPDGTLAEDAFEPPDIAVEIISPGQTLRTLISRCQSYVDHGVEISLLVHPATGRSDASPATCHSASSVGPTGSISTACSPASS